MGNIHGLPESDAKQLVAKTRFKKCDLERWYGRFMKQFPRGGMNEEEFLKIYGGLFTDTFCSAITKHVFRSSDQNKDGVVSFQELMMTLSMTINGTNEEKVEWLFNVYDFDGNGKISLQEFKDIANAIQKVLQKEPKIYDDDEYDEDDDDGVHDFMQIVFDKIDKNDDGYLTLDEFAKGVKDHPGMVKFLHRPNEEDDE